MLIVFIGPPGAGKGTQSKLLIEYLSIPHLSTGDMLRQACADGTEFGLQVQQYIEAGELVPDQIMEQLVQQRLLQPDCSQGCLLDGFPRTIHQAESLEEFLGQRGQALDRVLELRVDEDVLVKRLAGRGRNDDKPEIVRQRLRMFYNRIEGLLNYYRKRGLLYTVDGLGTPEVVFDRIKSALNHSK